MSENTKTNSAGRIASIDILRGLTILVMIFVNDVAGVHGTPAWMKHISPPMADGMTFVDIVFPAFLFIVGMSVPFAIERRFTLGHTLPQIWKHILIRTAGLLIIGVFMVNSESLSDQGMLAPAVWTLLMYGSVFLIWQRSSWRPAVLRAAGIVLLAGTAVLYRGPGAQEFIELRPHWWGILGLIGWAYLVGCTVYLLSRPKLYPAFGAIGLLYLLYMADQAGFFASFYDLFPWISIGATLGSHGAIVVSGVILGMVLMPGTYQQSYKWRIKWAFVYGCGLALAAILLHALRDIHQMFIINKILATPPWCLWSSAIVVWIWIVIYWLVDVRNWDQWTFIVEPAGANALFAYILAPVLYAVFDLSASLFSGFNFYHWLGHDFAIGFFRSVLFAFGVTWLAGFLRKLGINLRL